VTFIIKRFFWIQNANYDKIIIQFSKLSVIFLKTESCDLPQNISINPMGQSANIPHFVAFFISIQNIVTLKLPFGANRGYW
jgi:hypothetical protein